MQYKEAIAATREQGLNVHIALNDNVCNYCISKGNGIYIYILNLKKIESLASIRKFDKLCIIATLAAHFE